VVIVTTPQEIALMDVRKQMDFCRRVGLPVLGVVENMCGFLCPKCHNESSIFKPSPKGMQQLLETGVPLLGRLPLDPLIGKACDEAIDVFEDNAGAGDNRSKTITAFEAIGEQLVRVLNSLNSE